MRLAAALLLSAVTTVSSAQERQKVAAGEHMTAERVGAGGTLDVLETREEWTMWRLADGGYEVQGRRRERSLRENLPREYPFELVLSPEMHPVRVPQLEWFRNLTACDFGAQEFRCRAGDDSVQATVRAPYDLFANSPWLLGSAALRAVRQTGRVTPLRMVLVNEDPVEAGSFRGWVHYLGEEQGAHLFKLDIGAQQWKRIRVAPEGVVLSMDDLRTKVRTELVRYEKFGGFGATP